MSKASDSVINESTFVDWTFETVLPLGTSERWVVELRGSREARTAKVRKQSWGPVVVSKVKALLRSWGTRAECEHVVIRASDIPDGELPVTNALAYFEKLVDPFQTVFAAAARLVRKGRKSSQASDRESAEQWQHHLKRLAFSLTGDWFFVWMNGLSVFLVNYRELMAKHEGEFVLIAAKPDGEEWEILGVSPEPAELVARAREAGLSTEQYFVREIIAGADQIPVLDFARPESTWEEGESEEAMGSSAGRECDAPDHT